MTVGGEAIAAAMAIEDVRQVSRLLRRLALGWNWKRAPRRRRSGHYRGDFRQFTIVHHKRNGYKEKEI